MFKCDECGLEYEPWAWEEDGKEITEGVCLDCDACSEVLETIGVDLDAVMSGWPERVRHQSTVLLALKYLVAEVMELKYQLKKKEIIDR